MLPSRKQPRSGERIQPTAQAVGEELESNEPQRGERLVSTKN